MTYFCPNLHEVPEAGPCLFCQKDAVTDVAMLHTLVDAFQKTEPPAVARITLRALTDYGAWVTWWTSQGYCHVIVRQQGLTEYLITSERCDRELGAEERDLLASLLRRPPPPERAPLWVTTRRVGV